jgi:hypothetical protein
MAIFTHGSGSIFRCIVEQFKIELNFERFNPTFL